MNSSLASALSEFSKGQWATEPSKEPPHHLTEVNLVTRVRSWLGKAVPFASVRILMIFFIGVAATLAWQSYGGAARETMARWSPRLGWLAPPAASTGVSPYQIVAISRDLAVVRQSVDKLAVDLTKLRASQQGAVRKPDSQTPPTARAERLKR